MDAHLKCFILLFIAFLIIDHCFVIKNLEMAEMNIWQISFEQINIYQYKNKKKYTASKLPESNYAIMNNKQYCMKSDAYKALHKDSILKDTYVWRDSQTGPLSIATLKKSFAVFPDHTVTKKQYNKQRINFPLELSYLFLLNEKIYSYFDWGRGIYQNNILKNIRHRMYIPEVQSYTWETLYVYKKFSHVKQIKNKTDDIDCIVKILLIYSIKRNATIQPQAYRLEQSIECLQFFQYLNSEQYENLYQSDGPQFIIKTSIHNGRGVTILSQEEKLKVIYKYANGSLCGKIKNRLLAQKYISNPFLYKGHKIELRQYIIIASTDPVIVYSYKRQLIRRCPLPFDVNSQQKGSHVCNSEVVKYQIIEQISNENFTKQQEGDFYINWDLQGLQDILYEQNRIPNKNWLEEVLYPNIHSKIIHMIMANQGQFDRDSRFSEPFGIDFVIDNNLDIWLIEVQYHCAFYAVSEERIKFIDELVMDTFEIHQAYVRSKYIRIINYVKQVIIDGGNLNYHLEKLTNLQVDRLEPEIKISDKNNFVIIYDGSLQDSYASFGLIKKKCL